MLQAAQRLMRCVQTKVFFFLFLLHLVVFLLRRDWKADVCLVTVWAASVCFSMLKADFFPRWRYWSPPLPPCCAAAMAAMLTRCHLRTHEKVNPISDREIHGRVGTGWRLKSIMHEVFACPLHGPQSGIVFRDPSHLVWPVVITAAPAASLPPAEQPSVDNLLPSPGIKVLLM